MTIDTLTLTAFLLARIEEDESVAGRAGSFTPWDTAFQNDNYGHLTVQPSRIEAECAAKRAIVELHSKPGHQCPGVDLLTVGIRNTEYVGERFEENHGCQTLVLLASVYAAHDDYRADWAL